MRNKEKLGNRDQRKKKLRQKERKRLRLSEVGHTLETTLQVKK